MLRLTPRRILFLVLAAALAAPGAPAQTPPAAAPAFKDAAALPEGRIGARIQSLIGMINSGDPGRIKRFFEEECTREFRGMFPIEEHIAAALRLRRDTGGVDFYSIRTFTPEQKGWTVAVAKDRLMGGWWALSFRIAEGPESLVAGLRFGSARAPAGVTEPPLTEAQALDEIRALTAKVIKSGWYSGSVLVAKGDKVLHTDVGGEASKAYRVPNNLDTKFNLGSMNKMFTSTAVARLVEAGRLSFDDAIDKFIDESWLPKDITSKITVRHLITHTSGLGSYFNDTYMKSARDLFRKLDDYKPLIKDEKPAFAPGSRYKYSNTGMFLLGVILEKVTGEDYFDHIRKTIYGPAGMTNSDSFEMDYPVENLAIGYSPDPNSPAQWQNNLYKHVIKGGPAGGGFSTVKDLHRFALALLSDKFVSRTMRDTMWTDFNGSRYGYGFAVVQSPLGKAVGHGGGFPGINSQLDIYVDAGYIVAAMCNYDSGANALANRIGQILARVKSR